MQAAIPFAVMASNTVVEVNGRKIRGRLYPWGIVEGKDIVSATAVVAAVTDVDV